MFATNSPANLPARHLSRVMCIEDNRAIRDMLCLALTDLGKLSVSAYACGEEALEAFDATSPEIILLDWDLPGISATETLRRIRSLAQGQAAHVLVMSARYDDAMEAAARAAGAAGVLKKPLDPMRLASDLRLLYSQTAQRLN